MVFCFSKWDDEITTTFFLHLILQKKLGYRKTSTVPVDEDCLVRTQCAYRTVSSTQAFQNDMVYLFGMNDLLVFVC